MPFCGGGAAGGPGVEVAVLPIGHAISQSGVGSAVAVANTPRFGHRTSHPSCPHRIHQRHYPQQLHQSTSAGTLPNTTLAGAMPTGNALTQTTQIESLKSVADEAAHTLVST